ncbi:MAG TPA: SBBP repeat-containing protein [Gemmatimonadales bacterium]|jgi:hypothetical protein|nr:SBBP repeat-containing protein [Gemmatimonadales bacterium]
MTRSPVHRVLRFAVCCAALWTAQCENGTSAGNIVAVDSLGFHLGFSTYLGGAGTDMVRDVAIDPQGNVYVGGSTRSPDFPVTSGALDGSLDPGGTAGADAFVTKYDASGHLVWSTFLGGPGYERVYGLEVDEQGFVYVAGRAGIGFPVTAGALQTTFGGSTNPQAAYGPTDGFVCKIRPDGSGVVFCTYFGNEDFEPIRDIAIDANHDIYVATSVVLTGSFPAAWFTNAFQKTVRGDRDALVAKITGDGSRVEWATLLGGTNYESNGISVRAAPSGIFVATTTTSADMPTPNGFAHSLRGSSDVYLAKLSLDGSQLLYGTYVGGSGAEQTETHHLAIDGQGNALVVLGAPIADFSTTPGAFQAHGGGNTDVLVVKVSPDGQLAAATYLGGGGEEWAEGVANDSEGNVYLTGFTGSPDFPLTGGQGPGGGTDLIAVTLSSDLSRLLFSRRLGGSGDDSGRSVAIRGSAFLVAGMSDAPNWPLSSAAQSSLRGGTDGIIAAFARSP